MPVTTLAFLRKRQAIADLSGKERPQSHAKLRTTVLRAIIAVETELRQREINFYANQLPIKTIRKWSRAVNHCLKSVGQSHINIAAQLTSLLHRVAIAPREPEDELPITILHHLDAAIDSAIASTFTPAIKSLESILELMQRYCLSFCPKNEVDGEFLCTAQKYENGRLEYTERIRKFLHGADDLKGMFQRGFLFRSLSFEVQEIGHKALCEDYPFILLFAQGIHFVREACNELKRWLDEDTSYAYYIKDDLKNLEELRGIQLTKVRELKDQIFQLKYKHKKTKQNYEVGSDEMTKLKPKFDQIQDKEINANANRDKLRLDLQVIQLRRLHAKRNESQGNSTLTKMERVELKETLISELSRAKTQYMFADRRVHHLERSLTWIETKRDTVQKTYKEAKILHKEVKSLQKLLNEAEREVERMDKCCIILKDIARLKESSETLKKIFLNVPVRAGLVHIPTTDLLGRAIRIVIRHICNDWIKLYRALPFSPWRGEEERSRDIQQIDSLNVRGAGEDQCKQALLKWRRLHRRAKFPELKEALQAIKRHDILLEMQILIRHKEIEPEKTLEEKFFLPTISCQF